MSDQGVLDQLVNPAEMEALLEMLTQFGQLSREAAEIVYEGASLSTTYPRAGYRIQPSDVRQPGRPWQTLSLDDILASDFWQSEMFNDLNYNWQATLMQPVDGMDMIVRGFLNAEVADGRQVSDLVVTGQPVTGIDTDGRTVTITTRHGQRAPADYVIATIAPPILAGLDGGVLDGTVREILKRVEVDPACKVGWQGRSRFWETEDRIYGGISWTKDVINQIWYPSYGFNGPTGVLTGAYDRAADAVEFEKLSRPERLEVALAGGEKLHPGFRDKVFARNGVSIAWSKMPYQAGGWAAETAFSQPEVFDLVTNADPIGRLYLAGDWFSYYPGWQEGALDSAHFATDLIACAALGRG